MKLLIRPFNKSDEDYKAVTAIWNATWPDEPESPELQRHWDESRDPARYLERLVGEDDGAIVASMELSDRPWSYKPGHYEIFITVHPDHQGRGYGSTLFERGLAIIAEREPSPLVLMSATREDRPRYIDFLTKRGFEQVMRYQVSALDLATFDPAPFEDAEDRVRTAGIEIRSIAEIASVDPDWKHKWYEHKWEVFQDVPLPEPPTKQPFEVWLKQLDAPNFTPHAHWVALDGERFVGTTGLWLCLADPTKIWTGLTGVARSHRRKRIATALKLRAIRYAVDEGYRFVETDNEENNPMYQLNVRLGFTPKPAWLDFRRSWSEGATAGDARERTDRAASAANA